MQGEKALALALEDHLLCIRGRQDGLTSRGFIAQVKSLSLSSLRTSTLVDFVALNGLRAAFSLMKITVGRSKTSSLAFRLLGA